MKNNLLKKPYIAIIAIIIVFFMAKGAIGLREKNIASSKRINDLQDEILKLELHEKDLQKKISDLSTDQGIEAELKTKFRATRSGESVVVIVEESTSSVENQRSVISTSTNIQDNNR